MATKINIGRRTPAQLAEMCQERGARVERTGTTWHVYPPDPNKAPVHFTALRIGNGTQLDNILRDLRRGGIDLERAPAKPVPTTPTTEEPDVVHNASPIEMPPKPATVKDVADLRDMVRTAVEASSTGVETALEMLAEADKRIAELTADVRRQGNMITSLFRKVGDLEAAAIAGGAPPPESISSRIRRQVVDFLAQHPGLRMSPAMLEANMAENLPAERARNATAIACRELATDGAIKVWPLGGKVKPGGAPPVYWVEPEGKPEPAKD